jgi:membrane AbrB-like protein
MNPFAKALLVAVPAGALFSALNSPLPWMLGPLIACAITNLAGGGLGTPVQARSYGQWVIGTALGQYFAPDVLDRVAALAPWIVLAIAWTFALGLAFAWVLRRFTGASPASAFFGGAIGGASEMAVQGERAGGRVDQIAASHSLRITLVVLILPLAYRLLDLHGSDPYTAFSRVVDPLGLAMLVPATVAAALAFRALSWPNPWMLGPLSVSLGLTATGHDWSALPPLAVIAGQVGIGMSLGCRFSPAFFAQAPRLIAVVAASTVAGLGLCVGFAWAMSHWAGVPVATLALSTSPGGLAEMSLTAKTLQLGVPTVTAFHVTRSIAMAILLGRLYRVCARIRGWPA